MINIIIVTIQGRIKGGGLQGNIFPHTLSYCLHPIFRNFIILLSLILLFFIIIRPWMITSESESEDDDIQSVQVYIIYQSI